MGYATIVKCEKGNGNNFQTVPSLKSWPNLQ